MDAARDQFAAQGCSVLAVSQAKPEVLALYLSRMVWHIPFVCDPERSVYAAFELERTRWRTFFRPQVLLGYFRGMFQGYGVKKPYAGEDLLQLGGDFLLTRRREILYSYRSADPVDRPTVAALLTALQAVASPMPMPPNRPPDAPRVDSPSLPD